MHTRVFRGCLKYFSQDVGSGPCLDSEEDECCVTLVGNSCVLLRLLQDSASDSDIDPKKRKKQGPLESREGKDGCEPAP